MTRYYFDTGDGIAIRDKVGVVYATDRAARVEALDELADMARCNIPNPGQSQTLTMRVRDDSGREVIAIAIALSVLAPN